MRLVFVFLLFLSSCTVSRGTYGYNAGANVSVGKSSRINLNRPRNNRYGNFNTFFRSDIRFIFFYNFIKTH